MTNLDSIFKSRDITLPTKVRLGKAMVFPVVTHVWMWELDYKESWAQHVLLMCVWLGLYSFIIYIYIFVFVSTFKMINSSVQFSRSVMSNSLWCMNHSTPGLIVHQQLLKLTQIHVHWVSDAIQPSHPVSSPSPPTPSPSQYQGPSQWVSSLHEVAKVLEFQFQHQSFQWTPRTDLL